MKRLITFGDYEKPKKRRQDYDNEARKKRHERYLKKKQQISDYNKQDRNRMKEKRNEYI